MEGIFFYWFAWIGWAYSTFLMKTAPRRTVYSALLLILLITHGLVLDTGRLSIHCSFLILALSCYLWILRLPFKMVLYYVFCTFLIALSYNAMLLFSMYDPVWIVVQVKWLLAGALFVFSLMLIKDSHYRPLVLTGGFCVGEALYHLVIQKLTSGIELGSLNFLDVVTLSLALCFVSRGVQQFGHFLSAEAGKGKMIKRVSRVRAR
ncbi:YphA family membrane protein [Fictibacillus sp. NRS-1165]|uniref:YphA family membrane protein n=1 Tax=Fictibacillus sp. NRS-1165 TaxID=3144463 RepID=UPI003D1DCD40